MKQYIKPYIEIIAIEKSKLMDNSEPQVSGNIGAKENNMFFDWDDNDFGDTWNNDEDTEPIS